MSEETSTKSCVVCELSMPAAEEKCPTCGSLQRLQLCVVCKAAIPLDADYCNQCKSNQGRIGRHLPLSATVPALLALLLTLVTSAIVPLYSWWMERNSHTFVKVTGANPQYIVAKAWNTGRRPSTLVAYRLTCDAVSGRAFFLDLSRDDKLDAKNVIESRAPQRIRLSIPVADPQQPPQPQMTDSDRLIMASAAVLTLEVDIKESDDLEGTAGKIHHYRDRFDRKLIEPFLVQVRVQVTP